MIPAYHDATHDTALWGDLSLAVYLHLAHDVLDTDEYREVKQLALATELEVSEGTIRASLRKLVRRGYVKPGTHRPGKPRRYKLVYSRAGTGTV